MSALIGSLFAAWWPQIIGGLAALAGLAGVYLKGRAEGKDTMREEQERHRREAIANKRKLDDEIDNLGHADLDQRASRWVRPEHR